MHFMHFGANVNLPADLLDRVRETLSANRTRQRELSAFCGVSQPHISKVLARQVALSKGMAARLEAWMAANQPDELPKPEEIEALIEGFSAVDPKRRMHILHILRELSALA